MKKHIIDSFFKSRFQIDDRYEAVRYRINNRLDYDMALIENFVTPQSKVLDLGCGTGIIEDRLESKAAFIRGVDKYQEFLSKAKTSEKVEYTVGDVADYRDDLIYDVILIFGVLIYLSADECEKTLRNCKSMLSEDGVLIIKNQFGVDGKVVVDRYSEELNSNYYAEYHKLVDMLALLDRLEFQTDVVDIYPPELNRWTNTHEYALICRHK